MRKINLLFVLFHVTKHKNISILFLPAKKYKLGEFWSNMATSEDAEHTSSHRHTESTATREKILSKRIPSDDSCTLGEQEKNHMEMGRKSWDIGLP